MSRIQEALTGCERYLSLGDLDGLEKLLNQMTQFRDERTLPEMQRAMRLCKAMLPVYHRAVKIDIFEKYFLKLKEYFQEIMAKHIAETAESLASIAKAYQEAGYYDKALAIWSDVLSYQEYQNEQEIPEEQFAALTELEAGYLLQHLSHHQEKCVGPRAYGFLKKSLTCYWAVEKQGASLPEWILEALESYSGGLRQSLIKSCTKDNLETLSNEIQELSQILKAGCCFAEAIELWENISNFSRGKTELEAYEILAQNEILQLNKSCLDLKENNEMPLVKLNYQPSWIYSFTEIRTIQRTWLEKFKQSPEQVIVLQKEFTLQVIRLIHDLSKEIEVMLGKSDFDFCLLGIGSITRGMYPYSDIDIAVLVDDEGNRCSPYLQTFLKLFELTIKFCGQPEGFHIDSGDLSFMFEPANGWGDERPLTINSGQGYLNDQNLKDNFKVAHSVYRPVVLFANTPNAKRLYTEYLDLLSERWNKRVMGRQWLDEHFSAYKELFTRPFIDTIDLKEDVLRPLELWILNLALLWDCRHDVKSISAWIEQFTRDNKFSSRFGYSLMNAFKQLVTFRTEIHKQQGYCHDRVDVSPELEKIREAIFVPIVSLVKDEDLLKEAPVDLIISFYAQDLGQYGAEILNLGLDYLSEDKRYVLPLNLQQLETLFWQVLDNPNQWKSNRHELLQLIVQSGFRIDKSQRGILASSVNQDDPALFLELIALGAGRSFHARSLVDFVIRHDQHPGMKEAISQLSKINREFGLAIAKRYLLDKTQAEKPSVRLVDLNNETFTWKEHISIKEILWKQALKQHKNQYGRRTVLEAKHEDHYLHLKIAPEIPGLEMLVQSLAKLLDAQEVVAASEVYRGEQDQPGRGASKTEQRVLQLSQHVAGENFWGVLKDKNKTEAVLAKLDKKSFTRLLFLSLFSFQEDGNPTNYIVESFINDFGQEKYRLVCVDNDHAFLPELGRENQLLMKSILFCLPNMENELDREVLLSFAEKDPYTLLTAWCELLEKAERRLLDLFPETLRRTLYGGGQENTTIIAMPISGGYIPKLYQVWQNLKNVIKEREGALTGSELLRYSFPMVGHRYEELNQLAETKLEEKIIASQKLPRELKERLLTASISLKRFGVLTENAYEWKKRHSVSRMTSKKYIDIRKMDKVMLLAHPEHFGPTAALLELESALTESNRVDQIQNELINGNIKPFEGAYLDKTKSDVLRKIDFATDIASPQLEKKILNSLAQQSAVCIYLKGCSSLTDEQLSQWLKVSPFLTHLSLESCPNIRGTFLESCRYTPVLRSVRIVNGKQFTMWPTTYEDRLWLSTEKGSLDWSSLRYLELVACPLSKLVLKAKQLKTVHLESLPNLLQANLTVLVLEKLTMKECDQVDRRVLAYGLLKTNPNSKVGYELLVEGDHFAASGMPITLKGIEVNKHIFAGIKSADLRSGNRLGEYALASFMEILPHCQEIRWLDYYRLSNGPSKTLQKEHSEGVIPLANRPTGVRAFAVLPSGELVSGYDDGRIRVWDVSSGRCLQTLERHNNNKGVNSLANWPSGVRALAVLPRGELVSGYDDGRIRVWDVSSGRCLHTLKEHAIRVNALAILPSGELVSGYDDGRIRVWDVSSGRCLQTLEGSGNIKVFGSNGVLLNWPGVRVLAILPSGELVSGYDNGRITVWDISSWRCLQKLDGHNNKGVNSLAVLPSGALVSGSADKTIRVWDAETGECRHTLTGHSDSVVSLAILPNGALVSGSEDKTIRVWDAERGACLHTLEGHTSRVTAYVILSIHGRGVKVRDTMSSRVSTFTILPNGELVSGHGDRTIRVWSFEQVCIKHARLEFSNRMRVLVSDKQLSFELTETEKTQQQVYLDQALLNYQLAYCTSNALQFEFKDECYQITVENFKEMISLLRWFCAYVCNVTINVSEIIDKSFWMCKELISYAVHWHFNSKDNLLAHSERCRYLSKGFHLETLDWSDQFNVSLKELMGYANRIQLLAVLPSGALVSGSSDEMIRVWDAERGVCLHTLTGHTDYVYALAVLLSGALVSGSLDKTIRVWDAEWGQCLRVLEGHTDCVNVLAILPSGILPSGELVSGSSDETIRVWDVETGECLQMLEGHTSSVRSLAILPSGALVSGSKDGTIRVWDAESGVSLHTLTGHTSAVYALAVLPSGALVSGSGDQTIRVWDAESGVYLHTLTGHTDYVYALAVLLSGALVSGSRDQTIRVWDAETGKCLQVLKDMGPFSALAILPSGALVSGFEDGTIRVQLYHQSEICLDFSIINLMPSNTVIKVVNKIVQLQISKPNQPLIDYFAKVVEQLVGCAASCITLNSATELHVEKLWPVQRDYLFEFFTALIQRAKKREEMLCSSQSKNYIPRVEDTGSPRLFAQSAPVNRRAPVIPGRADIVELSSSQPSIS